MRCSKCGVGIGCKCSAVQIDGKWYCKKCAREELEKKKKNTSKDAFNIKVIRDDR